MSVLAVTKANFDALTTSEKPVLIDFYADWCGPCKMMSPVVDEIAEERSDLLVAKINVDDNPDLAAQFNVASIPTLVAMKDGNIIGKSIGYRPKKAVLSMFD